GLEPDARQLDERLEGLGHLAAVMLDERLRHAKQRARLGAEESGGADLLLEARGARPRQLAGRRVLAEERGRHHVHALVRALRGEDGGDEQLERRPEVEGDLRVGIRAREEIQDLLGPRLLRRTTLRRHPHSTTRSIAPGTSWTRVPRKPLSPATKACRSAAVISICSSRKRPTSSNSARPASSAYGLMRTSAATKRRCWRRRVAASRLRSSPA